ncbi:MAG: protein kinase [Actinomycetota bacterium]
MDNSIAPGDVLGGRWEITGVLGSGGFGQVFAAEDVSEVGIGRAAVKVLHPNTSPQERSSFLAEVQKIAQLRHQNLVGYLDSGQFEFDSGAAGGAEYRPYLVAELCDSSLDDRLKQAGGPLDTREVLMVLDHIVAGLAHLHERGMIHRDIKPANVLHADGQWKLADFGLMRDLSATGTYHRGDLLIGTPIFMAPELFATMAATPPSDIYAMGVLTHLAAAGRPLHAGTGQALAYNITSTAPSIAPELDPGIADLVAWTTAHDPAQRPTAHQLAGLVTDLRRGGPSSGGATRVAPSVPSGRTGPSAPAGMPPPTPATADPAGTQVAPGTGPTTGPGGGDWATISHPTAAAWPAPTPAHPSGPTSGPTSGPAMAGAPLTRPTDGPPTSAAPYAAPTDSAPKRSAALPLLLAVGLLVLLAGGGAVAAMTLLGDDGDETATPDDTTGAVGVGGTTATTATTAAGGVAIPGVTVPEVNVPTVVEDWPVPTTFPFEQAPDPLSHFEVVPCSTDGTETWVDVVNVHDAHVDYWLMIQYFNADGVIVDDQGFDTVAALAPGERARLQVAPTEEASASCQIEAFDVLVRDPATIENIASAELLSCTPEQTLFTSYEYAVQFNNPAAFRADAEVKIAVVDAATGIRIDEAGFGVDVTGVDPGATAQAIDSDTLFDFNDLESPPVDPQCVIVAVEIDEAF